MTACRVTEIILMHVNGDPRSDNTRDPDSGVTDRQVDRLVYQPYGLTNDRIRIVEHATRWARRVDSTRRS